MSGDNYRPGCNAEGYHDPTASAAIENITHAEKDADRRDFTVETLWLLCYSLFRRKSIPFSGEHYEEKDHHYRRDRSASFDFVPPGTLRNVSGRGNERLLRADLSRCGMEPACGPER